MLGCRRHHRRRPPLHQHQLILLLVHHPTMTKIERRSSLYHDESQSSFLRSLSSIVVATPVDRHNGSGGVDSGGEMKSVPEGKQKQRSTSRQHRSRSRGRDRREPQGRATNTSDFTQSCVHIGSSADAAEGDGAPSLSLTFNEKRSVNNNVVRSRSLSRSRRLLSSGTMGVEEEEGNTPGTPGPGTDAGVGGLDTDERQQLHPARSASSSRRSSSKSKRETSCRKNQQPQSYSAYSKNHHSVVSMDDLPSLPLPVSSCTANDVIAISGLKQSKLARRRQENAGGIQQRSLIKPSPPGAVRRSSDNNACRETSTATTSRRRNSTIIVDEKDKAMAMLSILKGGSGGVGKSRCGLEYIVVKTYNIHQFLTDCLSLPLCSTFFSIQLLKRNRLNQARAAALLRKQLWRLNSNSINTVDPSPATSNSTIQTTTSPSRETKTVRSIVKYHATPSTTTAPHQWNLLVFQPVSTLVARRVARVVL